MTSRKTDIDETTTFTLKLLVGENGMAALTFCNVPVSTRRENHR
jgi:hypothetical protein